VARDVARTPRVGVVAPGPADLTGALEDDEILTAGATELRGHRDPGEPGADDRDVGFGRQRPAGSLDCVYGGGRFDGHLALFFRWEVTMV
jgi:hypothetical protein